MVLSIFGFRFLNKVENKVSACLYEIIYYIILRNLSSKPLHEDFSDFQVATCVSKSYSDSGL
jgi:hypothetical protein